MTLPLGNEMTLDTCALVASDTVSVVTTYGELLGHFLDALQPEPAVLPRVPLIITSSKLREVLLENALQQVLRPWQIASVGLWGWLR